jgi:hypothetical protein
MRTVTPEARAAAKARPALGQKRSAIRAGIAAALPARTVRVSPNRSAIRPPSRVPATPPVRKHVSASPATGRLACRWAIQ